MTLPAVQEYMKFERDDLLYTVCAKVFPLPNAIASVWVFIGLQIPLDQETIAKLAEDEETKAIRLLEEEQAERKKQAIQEAIEYERLRAEGSLHSSRHTELHTNSDDHHHHTGHGDETRSGSHSEDKRKSAKAKKKKDDN